MPGAVVLVSAFGVGLILTSQGTASSTDMLNKKSPRHWDLRGQRRNRCGRKRRIGQLFLLADGENHLSRDQTVQICHVVLVEIIRAGMDRHISFGQPVDCAQGFAGVVEVLARYSFSLRSPRAEIRRIIRISLRLCRIGVKGDPVTQKGKPPV